MAFRFGHDGTNLTRLVLAFAFAATLYGQTESNVVTLIPKTDLSATGELRFRDKQAASHNISFKAPASLSTNLSYTLWSADASGPVCSNGAGVLSINTCGSGANTSLSNLTSTAINQSLLPGADDAYALGDATHRYASLDIYSHINLSNVGVLQWGPSLSANLNSAGGATFQSAVTVNGAITVTSCTGCGGSSGANVTLSNLTSPTAINQSLLPNSSGVWSSGDSSHRWANVYAVNVDVSGTCNGCVPSDMMTTDTNQVVTGTKNFTNANILLASSGGAYEIQPTDDFYSLGDSTHRFANVWVYSAINLSNVGVLQWGPSLNANLNSAGGGTFQSDVTINGAVTPAKCNGCNEHDTADMSGVVSLGTSYADLTGASVTVSAGGTYFVTGCANVAIYSAATSTYIGLSVAGTVQTRTATSQGPASGVSAFDLCNTWVVSVASSGVLKLVGKTQFSSATQVNDGNISAIRVGS